MATKKYTITCTEEQLRLIANAVEDYSLFIAGDCRMFHATSLVKPSEAVCEVRNILDRMVKPLITPDLHFGSTYDWAGCHCPDEAQRKAIAMSYGIYRQILHHFALQHPENTWNTYLSPTLTCPEQGGLIQIEERKEE